MVLWWPVNGTLVACKWYFGGLKMVLWWPENGTLVA